MGLIRLHGISVLMSVTLREWQYKEVLDEIEDQVWGSLAEEWAVHTYEEGDSPT